jgi:hypothetical protein
MGEAVGGGGPDVEGCLLFENALVAFEGFGIPVVEFFAFIASSFGGSVVEVLTEGVATEIVPVAAGIHEVEVPGLIDFFRWGDGMSGDHREGDEAVVFFNDTGGKDVGPRLFAGEATGEGKGGPGVIELKGEDFRDELLIGLFGLGFHPKGIISLCELRIKLE